MRARLDVVAARGRLASIAQPCLIWGLATVLVVGAVHLYYLPHADDMELLTVTLTRIVALGAGLWTMPHAAVLWWLHRPGPAGLVLFVLLGGCAASGVGLILWQITSTVWAALVGLLVGGWVFVVELGLALRVVRSERRA